MIKLININEDVSLLQNLLKGNQFEFNEIEKEVSQILKGVREDGDKALKEYTKKYDGILIDNLLVSKEEIDCAMKDIEPKLMEDLKKSKDNIEKYHKKQIRTSYSLYEEEDIILGQLVRPIERVGIYVPGGSAAYPSTVLMNALPAKIAGVNKIVMISPPGKDGKIKNSILAAAALAGVDEIYKVGGAQGIGALAYGTESIEKVDKITGPGNAYVAMAKKMCIGQVGIDMIAGPSEILIIADQWANPKYIAADLIAQAEHDEMARAILITNWEPLGKKVLKEIEVQIEFAERKNIIKKSLKDNGAIICTDSLGETMDIANKIAAEHVQILTRNPFEIYKGIKNAGAIFLGEYSPEALGDYYAGSNHVLPTGSTSRFSSPLSVEDFIKKSSLVYYSKKALEEAKDSIIRIAEAEGLTGHANSVRARFQGV